jgi:hypothetical protein
MAYELATPKGMIRLVRAECRWVIMFHGKRCGGWLSPDDAAKAAAHHSTGLDEWDQTSLVASDDILRWRPLGDSL